MEISALVGLESLLPMSRFFIAAEDVFFLNIRTPVVFASDVLLALRACKGLAHCLFLFVSNTSRAIKSSVPCTSVSKLSGDTQLVSACVVGKAFPPGKGEIVKTR